ncbi:hypothetical protein GQ44DRAFT_739402 [Phaeosphaeriaceae sp. PMI808]|nr:hypothetical protein GQ44DRAFT_739402 [Phaeosphaeriaceae sp. PMI808]
MTRRNAGFVNKKPHRKSRGGCLTCKGKKVKPINMAPVAHASIGLLTPLEMQLLNHYKTSTWKTFAVRGGEIVHALHRERVPNISVSHSYLLYALLSIAASHCNALQPSKQRHEQALVYRQKAYQTYIKELQNITSNNYESILLTGTFLLALIETPKPNAEDEEYMNWMYSLLKLSEGLRILASLKWGEGIEKLSIYPLICRELRILPPPPIINTPDKPPLQTQAGRLGTTPDHPNPASTYNLPFTIPFAGFVFLPPSLMSFLEKTANPPEEGPLDLDRKALLPVFYALSPIFLSLYYYHMNPDFNVRVSVMSSFLMPEFIALVKAREPRALVLVAWWYALTSLVTNGWWAGVRGESMIKAIGRLIKRHGNPHTLEAFEGVEKMIDVFQRLGINKAAESIFDDWEGVDWDEGPKKAEEWESGMLVDLCDNIGFDGLDLNIF